MPVSYQAQSPVLGMVLPSNSPGVHTLWLPIIPMQIGLVLKPGPQEPWTPYRMTNAFVQAGIPKQAIADLSRPRRHRRRGAQALPAQPDLRRHRDGRAVQGQPARAGARPRLQQDHPRRRQGRSVGEVHRHHGRQRLHQQRPRLHQLLGHLGVAAHARRSPRPSPPRSARSQPLPPEDPKSALAAFTVPGQADGVNADIDSDLKEAGVTDMTAKYGTRLVKKERCDYLRPTVIHCDIAGHGDGQEGVHVPVRDRRRSARRTRCSRRSARRWSARRSPRTRSSSGRLIDATHIDRLNIGPIPTIKLNWLQPHEGSIVDFLFRARAFQFEGR